MKKKCVNKLADHHTETTNILEQNQPIFQGNSSFEMSIISSLEATNMSKQLLIDTTDLFETTIITGKSILLRQPSILNNYYNREQPIFRDNYHTEATN